MEAACVGSAVVSVVVVVRPVVVVDLTRVRGDTTERYGLKRVRREVGV